MMLPLKQTGFTLIEVAIVLVVMTLILGGVMVGGTAVMENARTASLLSQIKDLAAASRDFKSRYGYYPGDLPNAATLITTDGGVSAGCSYPAVGGSVTTVGNGIVDNLVESRCALEHLVKARMLSGIESTGAGYRVLHAFGGGEVLLGVTPTSLENVVRVTNLPCKYALRIEEKLDNASVTPLALGLVLGLDSGGGLISTCSPGGANDPVRALLIKY